MLWTTFRSIYKERFIKKTDLELLQILCENIIPVSVPR